MTKVTPQSTSLLASLLMETPHLKVRQIFEGLELLGFETRNKYEIVNSQNLRIGYAAEQNKGFLGALMRHFLGHWRSFKIYIFNESREIEFTADHPFRFYFQRLDITDAKGKRVGGVQKRFAILSKKFDIEDANGLVLLTIRSPIWKIWTFPAYQGENKVVATIMKKWSGGLTEIFTDRDNFVVEFQSPTLGIKERTLLMAAAVFVDLQYFEKKGGN